MYFTTSVTVLYELPLVAVLSITGNDNVIFRTFTTIYFVMPEINICDCHKVRKNMVK